MDITYKYRLIIYISVVLHEPIGWVTYRDIFINYTIAG